MAKVYIGVNRGAGASGVKTGDESTGTDVEVVIDLAKASSHADVYLALAQIQAYCAVTHNWPPA